MAKNLDIEAIDSPALWDAFNAQSPQGSVFTSAEWLAAAAAAQGGRPVFLGVMKDGVLSAGVPFLEIVKGPLKKATIPILTPFGGMLFSPDPGKRRSEAEYFNMECAGLLIEELERRYSYSFLVHSPSFDDMRPFTWRRWSEKVRYTYIIDISDTDAVWDMMERRVRTVIRNAESSLTLGGAIELDMFTVLYERIFGDRQKSLPVNSAVAGAMAGHVLKTGLGEMRTVTDSRGTILSAMILVPDAISNRVYAWISGSIPGENSSGAFSLLFWDAIRRYSGTYRHLDMVGANMESIAFFKKGFGGTLTPYYVTEHFSSLFARIAFGLYGRARKIIS